MQTALAEAQERLLNATATISLLQSELSRVNTSVVSLKTEVTTNITILDLRKADETDFDILSSNLTKLSESVSRRDAVLNTTTEQLHVLARTALNQSHYDQLQDGIDMLETSKASQEDFETLLSNFTSLADSTVRTSDFVKLSAAVDDIDNSTVKKEEFFRLAENVTILQYHHGLFNTTLSNARARISELEDEIMGHLSTLEATKANQSDVNDLSVTVAMLNTTKVGITEFVVLSSSVSNLRALVITKADRDVVVDLEENLNILAANALNHSHYDWLQDSIDQLEISKTNQEDFETLLSNFTSFADNTVRTSDFLQLSADVDDIDNSTVKKEEFFRLAENVSTLEYHLGLINITLTSKADQSGVDQLTERLTTLSDTTVTNEVFETLAGTVQTLKTSKADRSSLSELETTVNHISDTAAKQSELRTLSGTVSDHITSSQNEHDQLTSNISANDRKIWANTDRISGVNNDVTRLDAKVNSTPGLTASWMTLCAAVSLVIIYTCTST